MAAGRIADLMGSMTIHLMQNTEDGDVRIKNGLSRKLDINPSGNLTRSAFISTIVRTLLIDGDGNCVVYPKFSRGGDLIEDLEILQPSMISFIPDGRSYDTGIKLLGPMKYCILQSIKIQKPRG